MIELRSNPSEIREIERASCAANLPPNVFAIYSLRASGSLLEMRARYMRLGGAGIVFPSQPGGPIKRTLLKKYITTVVFLTDVLLRFGL